MVRETFLCCQCFMHVFGSISKLIKMLQDTLKCWHFRWKAVVLLAKIVSCFWNFKIKIVVIINYSVKQTENKSQNHALSFQIYSHMPPQSREFSKYKLEKNTHICFVSKHLGMYACVWYNCGNYAAKIRRTNLEVILLFCIISIIWKSLVKWWAKRIHHK